ncbi:MAG: sensor histidine kinase [Aequorivita sp.]|nr:sensor histidine kinase [Aequorivita sp.]
MIDRNKINTVWRLVGPTIVTLLLIVGIISCNESAGPYLDHKTQKSASIAESTFEQIHSQVYDNPSAARMRSLSLLNSLEENDKISRIRLMKYIGSSYVFETNYPEAIKYYNEALREAESIHLYDEIANINNNLGTVFNESGSYTSAYIHFIAALDNYELAGKPEKKEGTHNNIGLTYLNINNHKKALEYFELALDTSAQPKNPILASTILNNIALCYSNENKRSEALENLNRSIALSKKHNNQYSLCISYKIMGDIYQKSGDFEKAFEAYTKSEGIAQEGQLFQQIAFAKTGLGRVLLERGNIIEAQKVGLEVLDMAEAKNSNLLKTDAHFLLSMIYRKKYDYQKSLEHFQQHVALKEELNNNTIVNQIYDVELKHLDQLNNMQQLEIDKKELAISNKNNLLFLLSLVFVLLLIGLYLVYRNHQHKQAAKLRGAVIEMNKKRSNAALEAEIRERKRIGQNLHDSLGYLLSLAGLQASVLHKKKNISDEKRTELINSLMESIDEAFNEVRNISHNLSPSLLSERGLKGALQNISNRVNQSSKLRMTFDTFGLDDDLNGLIENVLYRTLQEIVNNTLKHADASELFVQITQDEKEVNLIAEDNGKGFNYEMVKNNSGMGLANITSGIENLNGTIFIDAKAGRGAIISIIIPL